MRLSKYEIAVFIFVAFAAAMVACLFDLQLSGQTTAQHSDWRRTANGWERTDRWAVKPLALPLATHQAAVGTRLDPHPAAVALVQLVAVLAALAFFSRPLAHSRGLVSAISSSYRASFFGS
jgi:hypothetical protein